jgi:hypothetical protein
MEPPQRGQTLNWLGRITVIDSYHFIHIVGIIITAAATILTLIRVGVVVAQQDWKCHVDGRIITRID